MQPSGTCADVMSWKLESERAEAVVAMHRNVAPRSHRGLSWLPIMKGFVDGGGRIVGEEDRKTRNELFKKSTNRSFKLLDQAVWWQRRSSSIPSPPIPANGRVCQQVREGWLRYGQYCGRSPALSTVIS